MPDSEASFWRSLRDLGGPPFVAALDWVGLDAYPGTLFPPVDTPGDEGDALVNAMSALRCYLRVPGVPASVPIHVEENGFPTGPARSEERQVIAMESMIGTLDEFRGTFNVTDYRWFNLRDGDSTSPNFQQQYGIMTDLYAEKPAFARYRSLVAELSVREGGAAPPGAQARLRLRIRCRRQRWRVWAQGPSDGVRRVVFSVDGRHRARDRRPPFRRLLASTLPGRHRIAARVHTRGGRYRLARRAAGCRRAETSP